MKLKDKVAVVTGGGQGIGEGIATVLAGNGAKVAILDLAEDNCKKVVGKITAAGGTAMYRITNVTDYEAAKNAVEEVHKAYGSIDILINNVGTDDMKSFVQTDEALWDKLITVNYKSFLICSKVCIPYMMEQNSGKIISIASDSARAGQMNEVVYAGTKGAIISSTKALARELARYNVNVNCISPGPIDTPLIQELKKDERGQKIIEGTTRAIPFRRLGNPEEIGDLAAFFASEEAKYITGQILSINGGLTMIG